MSVVVSVLKRVWAIVKAEPVVISHIVAGALTLLAAFGFSLSAETTAEVMSVVQVVTAFITRNFTTPYVRSA